VKRFTILTCLALVIWRAAYVVSVGFNPIHCIKMLPRRPMTAEEMCPGITEYGKLNMFQRLGRIVGV